MLYTFKGMTLRCYELDGEIWFYGNDVARILGYQNASKAIIDHTSKDDRKALKYVGNNESLLPELWGKKDYREKVLINESGLYCLIFASKLDSAKEFKYWTSREVLPSIRIHGGYILDQEELSEGQKKELMGKIEKLSAQVNALKEKNAKLQARRHELISEVNKAKEKIRKQKVNSASLEEYASLWETMYDSIFKEYKLLKLRLKPVPVTKTSPVEKQRTYTVDKNGFVTF